MQLKNVVLALVGMSAAVEGSALRGRFHGVHGSAMLETRQNRGGNNGANKGGNGAAAAANGPRISRSSSKAFAPQAIGLKRTEN